MKKIIALLFGLLIFTFASTSAYADCPTQSASCEKGTISAKGEVQKDVLPDTVVLSFEVVTKDKNPQEALSLNKKRAKAVIDKLSAYLDSTKGDFVQTSRFSLNPRYVYENKKQKLEGYEARHTISLESHKVVDSGKFIDMAVEAGTNRVNNISFKLSNKDIVCQKYLKEASNKARMQADIIANAMGVKIGKIKRITYYCSSDNIRPYPMYRGGMLAEAKMANELATPVSPKNIKVKVSINVEFYLEE